MHMRTARTTVTLALLALTVACAPRNRATAPPQPDPGVTAEAPPATKPEPPRPAPTPPPRAERVEEAQPVAPRVGEDDLSSASLEDLNRNSLLKPAFFDVDSAELNDEGRAIVSQNADVLKKYPTWIVQIEGHADERGTAEYNLALGERRAQAARTYLLSLGVAGDRVTTISYGKEFPFDPGHTDAAWAQNRRAHFTITAK